MDAAGYESFIRDEKTHFWFVGRRAIFAELLRRYGPAPDESAVVADLGCGVGGMLETLGQYGSTLGMEVSADLLRMCRDRGFPSVVVGRTRALPLRSGAVDLVTLFDVLEHVPEQEEALAECLRVLRPGGRLFLSGPSYQFLFTHQDRVVHHQRRYTVRGIRRLFRRAGFEVVYASYINCFLFPAILPLLLARRLREAIVRPRADESRLNTEIAIPARLNALCARIFSAERRWLGRGSLPFGHSLVLVARKPAAATS